MSLQTEPEAKRILRVLERTDSNARWVDLQAHLDDQIFNHFHRLAGSGPTHSSERWGRDLIIVTFPGLLSNDVHRNLGYLPSLSICDIHVPSKEAT